MRKCGGKINSFKNPDLAAKADKLSAFICVHLRFNRTKFYLVVKGTLLILSLAIAPVIAQDYLPVNSPIKQQSNTSISQPFDDSSVPEKVKKLYWEDTTEMALSLLVEPGKTRDDITTIELPNNLVRKLYNALIQVYLATDLPARDAVVKTYEIHNAPFYILVVVNQNHSWTTAWQNGKRLTGNPEIDALMERFGLDLHLYEPNNVAILKPRQPLNTYALSKLFKGIAGVKYAEALELVDGNRIEAKIEKDFVELEYRIGWGDCPSGCIHRTYWKFRVYNDGRVEFLGQSGDSPPPPQQLTTHLGYLNPVYLAYEEMQRKNQLI